VLLGWPLLTAIGHTAGSAALTVVLAILLVRSAPMTTTTWPHGLAPGRQPIAS